MSDRPESAPTILIVDRPCDETARLLPCLHQEGYIVHELSSGARAIACLEDTNPDLLLIGVHLSDGSGYDLCQKIKVDREMHQIPIVFLGCGSTQGDKLQAFQLGGLDYLGKPFELEEAIARIRNHINLQSALKLLTTQNHVLVEEIQERQRVEAELRRSEQKFAKIFQASPNPITITRLRDGCHVDVNETFCQLTGYKAEEIIGRTAQELQLWASLEARAQLFERLYTEGSVRNYEFQFCTKDGQVRTALLSAEVIQLHGEDCLLALSNDITERVQVEVALQKANQALQRLATLDGLTQVPNRRCYDERLDQEWQRLQREQQPLSLILCDIDYFKFYNDTYGHQAGDACLQQVAQTLLGLLKRPGDLLARYGGEEFAVILPNTASEGAYQVAETMRQAVAALHIGHAQSAVSDHITLSLGVATTCPSNQFTPETLVGLADIALYEAKHQGRDRSVAEVF